MSMMCPPQSVKIASTPSVLSARATRWPPVISAGASAGVPRQLERVVGAEPLGDVRVALLERLDDLHVVDDRVGEALVLPNSAPADGLHVDEQAVDRPLQQLGAGQLDDPPVELEVRLRI